MFQSRKVLVVDDDAVVGQSINRVLTGQGYQVREALSGAEALEELDHQQLRHGVHRPAHARHGRAGHGRADEKEPPGDAGRGHHRARDARRARRRRAISGWRVSCTSRCRRIRSSRTPSACCGSGTRPWRRSGLSALALISPAATHRGARWPCPAPAVEARESVAKNVALFFAAPFIGLAYILAFPFVGVYAIGKYGYRRSRPGDDRPRQVILSRGRRSAGDGHPGVPRSRPPRRPRPRRGSGSGTSSSAPGNSCAACPSPRRCASRSTRCA